MQLKDLLSRMNKEPRKFVAGDHPGSTYLSRDHQEETRSRKRQRKEDEEDGEETEASNSQPSGFRQFTALKRDEEFYVGTQEDDEHVVRIFDTLFKVKESALAKFPDLRSRVYNGREAIPPDERWTDDFPLVLVSCTPEEFRAVLWFINCSEEELAAQPRGYPDVDRILELAPVCRTFGLQQAQQWTRSIIQRAADDDVYMVSCSSATLTKLVEAADRTGQPLIKAVAADKWRKRLLNKTAPPIPALQISEKYKLTELRGTAYYVQLQEMLERQTADADGMATQLRADPKLNNGQVMRLLAGYFSLVSFWERFRLMPMELARSEDCSEEEHSSCTTVWGKRWLSAIGWKRILGHNSADTLSLLNCLRDQLSNDDELKQGVRPSCRLAGLNGIKTKSEVFEKELVSHFGGCI